MTEEINWSDPNGKITKNFSVKEALWQSKNVSYTPLSYLNYTDKKNILDISEKMECIRTFFDSNIIIVHSWFRTIAYNELIKGAEKSMHLTGQAVDFHINKISCDDVKANLKNILSYLDIRMEDNGSNNWIHIDTKQMNRFFKP